MKIHITCLYEQITTSTAQIAQQMIAKVAETLDIHRIDMPSLYDDPKDDWKLMDWERKKQRLDELIKATSPGDIVIYQFPSWNAPDFDQVALAYMKSHGLRPIIFLHDYIPIMFKESYGFKNLIIHSLNEAEVIIVPTQAMYDKLVEHGLTVSKYLIQGIWDHPTTVPMATAQFKKELVFLGNEERFSFLKDWPQEIPMSIFTYSRPTSPHLNYYGYLQDEELLAILSQYGFGLVWHSSDDQEYMKLYSPYKLGTYLAAGIPVVVPKDFSLAAYIEEKHLGLTASSLQEAFQKITAMSVLEYGIFIAKVREWNPIIRQGLNMRRVLTEACSKIFE